MSPQCFLKTVLVVLLLASVAEAQQVVSLMTPEEKWSFDNGREFPGATGSPVGRSGRKTRGEG